MLTNFVYEYGLFLLKIATVVVAAFILVGGVFALKIKQRDKLQIKSLNEKYRDFRDTLNKEILSRKEYKLVLKAENKKNKKNKKRIFVLNFKGDIRADAVKSLREEITAILKVATAKDEVVLLLESSGGLIANYGLASSQLQRLRDKNVALTAIIDKVAASGGYLMACVADKICAAPFAIIGSIGVIGQLPNFNRLLKKHDIDYEQMMGGEFKRTITLFGENTGKAKQKFQEDINEAHGLFKTYVGQHRPLLKIEEVATGEYWYGTRALELGLVDKIITSDDYLLDATKDSNLFEITYTPPQKKFDKVVSAMSSISNRLIDSVTEKVSSLDKRH